MKLVVAFGVTHPAQVTEQRELEWSEYCAALSNPPETDDKASAGWSCPAKFVPAYRDSENLVARYALTLDYDHVTAAEMAHVFRTFSNYVYFAYTTWSHAEDKPRWRVVMPLSRPATYDEFQALSRLIASDAGIELAARESHVPAQMMFLPTRKPGTRVEVRQNPGALKTRAIDVDAHLERYENWTDRAQWPHRRDGDGVHSLGDAPDPTEKPGIVGAFCRAFDVPAAIAAFDLPYVPTNTPDRWTYTLGSRPEGAIVYDDGKKLHSHHDTDPGRGQNNAFDLVRLHKFADQDTDADLDKPVTERPSFKRMVELASDAPRVQAASAIEEFADLGPLPPAEASAAIVADAAAGGLARPLTHVLAHPTKPRWLIRDVLEHGTIVLVAGPRGSYKSFVALDWSMQVATRGEPVYVVSAEGGDFDRRAQAWLQEKTFDPDTVPPLYVVEQRIDLNTKDGIERIRQDCQRLGIRPTMFVLDTFSKLSGGLDENSNSEVKQFIGRIDNGLKRAFGATVLLVAHTGHSDTSRARGASALEADTEAAHIVLRDHLAGTVNISRERFKASPELPPLTYKPRIVRLGRTDEEGVEITSIVLDAVQSVAAAGPKRKLGKNQRLLMDTLKSIAADGRAVGVDELLSAATEQLPFDPTTGRDLRRQKLASALETMVVERAVFKHGNNISISRVEQATDEDFK